MSGLPCRQEVRTTRLHQPGRPAPMRSFVLELRVHPRPEPGLLLAPLQPLGEENLAHPAALHADALLAQVGHQAVQGPRRERQAQLGGPRQRRGDNRAALRSGVVGGRPERISSSSPGRPRSLKRLSQKRTVASHRPILAAIPGALRPSTACWMICARRTSPAPSFCERVIRASLCASSSRNARTRRVIATSPARTGTPCNAPDPEKSHPTYRIHHLGTVFRSLLGVADELLAFEGGCRGYRMS